MSIEVLVVTDQVGTKCKMISCSNQDDWEELKEFILSHIDTLSCSSELKSLYEQLIEIGH